MHRLGTLFKRVGKGKQALSWYTLAAAEREGAERADDMTPEAATNRAGEIAQAHLLAMKESLESSEHEAAYHRSAAMKHARSQLENFSDTPSNVLLINMANCLALLLQLQDPDTPQSSDEVEKSEEAITDFTQQALDQMMQRQRQQDAETNLVEIFEQQKVIYGVRQVSGSMSVMFGVYCTPTSDRNDGEDD